MDEKCELASKIVDYIWYEILKKKGHHSIVVDGGDEIYLVEAGNIFSDVLDIIDGGDDEG